MNEFDDILGVDVDHRSEKAIQNDTLVDLTSLSDSIFWRHNTGQAWQGKRQRFYPGTQIPVPPGTIVLTQARPVKFGLEGSGDIIGARKKQPVAVELKTAIGPQRRMQMNFERQWTNAGGIYILARSPDEAVSKVRSTTG